MTVNISQYSVNTHCAPVRAIVCAQFEPYSTKVEIRELLLSEEMRAITDVKVMDEVASNILISRCKSPVVACARVPMRSHRDPSWYRASQKMMDAYPDYDGGIL